MSIPSYPDYRTELWHGARDSLPMLVGSAPFALIFGTLAASSGLSAMATLAMSLFVYAGSSQFIAISLLAGGAGLAVIVVTTFVVNLRHALYSATFLPYVAGLAQRWRIPLAFWLTDETFAVVQHRYGAADASPHKHWYYLGSCLAMYSNWLIWTLVGGLLGHAVPGLDQMGLEFAMAATFTGIVVPVLKNRPMVAAALAAAVVALAARELPYKLGLMLAALAGVLVGLWLESREEGAK
ncbi:AzlC family ABC transporter permease [Chitinimonas sp. BJB300]|uniref:AzlC family ABC transporter permease n=1 Tax=Chitinimonas sp. BJB300 TaxID=1559339 RepID=UPI001E51BD04|nr:AzlC family ABC transporter permease [Chitinimonas sp. BJB300]